MNVLIIGTNSFIGEHIIRRLIKKEKVNIFLFTTDKKKISKHILSNIKTKNIFVIDFLKKNSFPKIKIDFIIDCGWIGVFGSKRNNFIQKKNIIYLNNLINFLKIIKPEVLISFGSQAEYGNTSKIRSEDLKVKPKTLYGKIKVKKLLKLMTVTKKLSIRFIWFRLFSTYGPREKYNWLIPYVIQSIIKKNKLKITSGYQYIDTMYIEDVVGAVIFAIKNKSLSGIYNLAYGKSYQVKTIVIKIKNLIDRKFKLRFGQANLRNHQRFKIRSSMKKLNSLGWFPVFNIDAGLKKTINYYKKLK